MNLKRWLDNGKRVFYPSRMTVVYDSDLQYVYDLGITRCKIYGNGQIDVFDENGSVIVTGFTTRKSFQVSSNKSWLKVTSLVKFWAHSKYDPQAWDRYELEFWDAEDK